MLSVSYFCYCGRRRITLADWIIVSYISLDLACRGDYTCTNCTSIGQEAVCCGPIIIEPGIFYLA